MFCFSEHTAVIEHLSVFERHIFLITLFFFNNNIESVFVWGWTFLNIFGISASNVLKHVLKKSLYFTVVCGTFMYTLICTCTLYCIKFWNTVAGTKENKRYNCKNCGLVNGKTCDVKLLSANFSQEAHRNVNFLITLYELFAIGYHHK